MTPFPHRYRAHASGSSAGAVRIGSPGVPSLDTDAPVEFGGPEGFWSPESLLVAAVADCFVLSFRAVARASRLEWERLTVDVEGTLERVEGATRFTAFRLLPRLRIRNPDDDAKAMAALDKAHRTCLVTRSLTAECRLEPQVEAPEPGLV